VSGVALVTGGSRGIGRCIAVEAASRGYDVVVAYGSRSADAQQVTSAVRAQGRQAIAVGADLRKIDDIEYLANAAQDFGPVSLLVNNAGITNSCALADLTVSDWHDAIALNLTAPAWLAKLLAPALRSQQGAIVNVASTGGLIGSTHSLAYGSSKAGLLGMTKTLARMLAPDVTVNALCPGMAATELLDGITPEQFQDILAGTPSGRIATPEEIAVAVLDVAAWKYCTGQSIVIDGGRVMH
jgi:3-oxoacyl-[acyl-carrier protein] reductase